MLPWLAIDYGAASTRAVLVWPGGSSTVLDFGGSPELSSAVHVSKAGIAVGPAAWQQATSDPDGFVLSPLRAGTENLTVAGTEVPVADLVAATLRQVGEEANRVAGERLEDVRLVVPAGWGPRRRTWLRNAARRAGLTVSRLVEAPIAATAQISRDARTVLVVDLGAGCEATVLAEGEVLSTLADPDCGGDRIDAALTMTLTGAELDTLAADQRWPLLAAVRTAKQALAEQPAVTMPVPGGNPPIVVNSSVVRQAAQPVLERAGQLAAEAVTAADLKPDQLDAVYLIGAAATTPGAVDTVAAKLGTTPQVLSRPELTAALGAADSGAGDVAATLGSPDAALRVPPLRRIVALALPGLASLALFGHFVFTADFNNGTPTWRGEGYYVLAVWGELTVAAVLAAITFLQAASLFAAILDQQNKAPARAYPESRITSGIALAAGAGAAVACLYAITAAVYFAYPTGQLLRWSLMPILPLLACVLLLAALTWKRRPAPAGGWDAFLTFSPSSMITAAVGTVAVALWWHAGLPWWANDWNELVGYTGGLLMGIGITCALVRHPAARIVLAVLLGFFTVIISRSGPNILAVIYALAVAAWFAQRTWTLARTTPTAPSG
ncbi:Hsp70 family protein [Actinoplanes sp. NBC_00393]|uniref:Hsp70 family protein n=1 Tax=Actinoplanes sp. NBC_00393 TaxID=2975953 RepID=UPI002E2358D1